ncbi:hypothetical protein, partial [Amphritea sp.]|uniref:hypothetical protein n=1 Tax=Amphritea sp. TaxID=1872502 RepID=UPI003A92DA9E
KLLMVTAAIISTSGAATPAINIGAMHSFIEPERSTLLKQIRNNGSSTAYVRITATEIEFSEDGKTQEVDIDRESLLRGEGYGLVVSPARMIIPVDGMQANRMLVVGERDVERYYRVRFVPVVPEKISDFGLTPEQAENYEKEVNAGISIMAGYGAIVVVRPEHTTYDTVIDESSNRMTLTNRGNSTVVLDAFAQCEAKQVNCHSYRVRYLRPGTSVTVDKTIGQSFQFTLVEGQNQTKMAFGDL